MSCAYSFYDVNETYRPRLYCKLKQGTCPYSKLCLREDRFILQEDIAGECYYMNEQAKRDVPEGACYVRFTKDGFLYVDLDDEHTIRVKDTVGTNPQYVYVKKSKDDYIASITPFKKATRKKKDGEE